jgi:hypothetical protein
MCLAHPNSDRELGKTCATLLAAARGCQAARIAAQWGREEFEGEIGGISERAQEFEKGFFLAGLQLFEFVRDMFRFSAVTEDGVGKGD